MAASYQYVGLQAFRICRRQPPKASYAAHKGVEIRDWLAANPRIQAHFSSDRCATGVAATGRCDSSAVSGSDAAPAAAAAPAAVAGPDLSIGSRATARVWP